MNHQKVKVFLASDSTVQKYDDPHQGGWGEFLQDYFTEDAQVENHAIGGRSSKTFIEEGRLEPILNELTENDFLLIQMGHNDSTKNRPERYTEPFSTYKEYLKIYVDRAKECHAKPVLITPVARLHVENDQIINDFQDYCTAMKEVAKEENVPVIDLMDKSLIFYQSIGYEETVTLFMASINETDFTHFTKKGANQIARILSEEIKASGLPLSKYIK
ncbi:rhamnogalacturonan acetylesterase [Bacillus sp. REN16]|nr:rhamnogalacturonan acetylesterase [Bacillus sp. REN16]MCC3355909.1 rhamnogalacturonan acetylesterase [Bacillus sp. REN16]